MAHQSEVTASANSLGGAGQVEEGQTARAACVPVDVGGDKRGRTTWYYPKTAKNVPGAGPRCEVLYSSVRLSVRLRVASVRLSVARVTRKPRRARYA